VGNQRGLKKEFSSHCH